MGKDAELVRSIVAVDIGSHSVKVVELELVDGRLVLRNCGLEELPYQQHDEDPVYSHSQTGAVIHRIIMECGITSSTALGLLSGGGSAVHYLDIPVIAESDIDTALKIELRKTSPFPIDQTRISHLVVGKIEKNGEERLDLLVGLAREEAARLVEDILEEAHLDPVALVVSPVAAKTLLDHSAPTDTLDSQTIAVIDIGAKRTSINIFSAGKPRFSREIPLAGLAVTEAIALSIAPHPSMVPQHMEEAETLKRNVSLSGSLPVSVDGGPQALEKLEKATTAARETYQKLIQRIRLSFGYFATRSSGERISRFFLVGGEAHIEGLPLYFKEHFGGDVTVLDPLCGLDTGELDDFKLAQIKRTRYQFAGAIGAAAAYVLDEKGQGELNLIRKDFKSVETVAMGSLGERSYPFVMAAAVLLLLSVIVQFAWTAFSAARWGSKLQAAEEMKQQLVPGYEQYIADSNRCREMEKRFEIVAGITGFKWLWSEFLAELSRTLPDEVVFESFECDLGEQLIRNKSVFSGSNLGNVLQNVEFKIRGTAVDSEALDYALRAIKSSQFVTDASESWGRDRKTSTESGMSFTVTGRLGLPATGKDVRRDGR